MLLKSGIILLILSNMVFAMPQPLDDTSTSATSTSVMSPDLMKICYQQDQCHCIKGVAICHNSRCHCLYVSSMDNSENLPTNGTDTLNESQQTGSPL